MAYAKAMEVLAQRYPKDGEAQLHYALTLNTSASPSRIAAPIAAIGLIEGSPPGANRHVATLTCHFRTLGPVPVLICR